jgi:drug/metabolite transporter (DMT)-like permease
MSLDDKLLGVVAALGSAASWALGSVLFKKLTDELSPIALTSAKGIVGSALLALALASTGFVGGSGWSILLLALSGVLGIAFGDTFFFIALRNLGAHAMVVLLTLGQVFTVMLAVLILGERPGVVECLGIVAILVGVAIVLWIRLRDEKGYSTRSGLAWGLASVVCMAVSVIIAKEALVVVNSLEAAFVRMVAGTAGVLVFGCTNRQLIGSLRPLLSLRFAVFFLFAVVVVTFGGFWLSLLAIEKINVSIATVLNSTEPLFVLPLAAFVLRETITRGVIFGSIITVVGITLLVGPW